MSLSQPAVVALMQEVMFILMLYVSVCCAAWFDALKIDLLARGNRSDKVVNDDRADCRAAWALFPGDIAYLRHGTRHATTVADRLFARGFDIRSQILWAKKRLVLSREHYNWQHEPC